MYHSQYRLLRSHRDCQSKGRVLPKEKEKSKQFNEERGRGREREREREREEKGVLVERERETETGHLGRVIKMCHFWFKLVGGGAFVITVLTEFAAISGVASRAGTYIFVFSSHLVTRPSVQTWYAATRISTCTERESFG